MYSMSRNSGLKSAKSTRVSRIRDNLVPAITFALSSGLATPAVALNDIPLSPPPTGLFENPFTGSAVIPDGTNAINYAPIVFDNQGDIRSQTKARITNASGATLNNDGYLKVYFISSPYTAIDNAGTLNNPGGIGWYGSILNASTGTINNTGNMFGYGGIRNAGTLDNGSGARIDMGEGVLRNDANGVVSNSGRISGYQSDLFNYGVFVNNPAGRVETDFFRNYGNLRNDGSINVLSARFYSGVLSGNGSVKAVNPITISAAATIAPGNPQTDATSTIQFDGDLASAGTWSLDVESLLDFDTVTVSGNAGFEPGSEISFVFDFEPAKGDVFDFFQAGSITGFENISFEATGFDSNYRVVMLGGDLRLRIVPVPAALPLLGSALLISAGLARRRKR